MPNFRRLYLYLVALISLVALMLGLIGLAGEASALLFNARPFRITGEELAQGSLLRWVVVVLVAGPLWAIHWSMADRTARPLTMAGAAERAEPARKAYLYLAELSALALLMLQAGLVLYDLIVRLLGHEAVLPDLLGQWPARPVALAAGAFIAWAFWLYLRLQIQRDGDAGHEPGPAAGWRRLYQYLAIFLGVVLATVGAAEVLRIAVTMAGGLAYTLGGGTLSVPDWRETAAAGLAMLIVGLPVAWLIWRQSDWIAADDTSGAEINSLGRKLLIYLCLLGGVIGTLLSGGFLVMVVALLVLGLPAGDPNFFWRDALAPALAYLPVALMLWWIFGQAVHDDMEWAPESGDSAVFRRLYFYLIAGLALAAFWYGLQQVLSVVLFLVFGLEPLRALTTQAARNAFSVALALLVGGGPAWLWHWRRAQGWARQPGPAGSEERSSLLRRIYLYGVVIAAAAVVVVTLAVVIYRAPSWLFDPGRQVEFMGALVQLGVAVALALTWWISTGMVMRTDARMLAEDNAWLAEEAAPEPASPGAVVAAIAAVEPAAGRLQYDRSQLPMPVAATAAAKAVPPAVPPVVVGPAGPLPVAIIDGGAGTFGAQLVAALRERLPQLSLWPVGLNEAAQEAMDRALLEDNLPPIPSDILRQALVILGPNDIVIPGGLSGEVPPELAAAVIDSPARKILLPPADPRLRWVAAPAWSTERWIDQAVSEVAGMVNGQA